MPDSQHHIYKLGVHTVETRGCDTINHSPTDSRQAYVSDADILTSEAVFKS